MTISDETDWAGATSRIKSLFQKLGCTLVGVAPVKEFPELAFFETWLNRGFAGEMAYLQRHLEKSKEPRKILPSVKTVLVCGQNYNTAYPRSTSVRKKKSRGWISRYAWGEDYHDVLKAILVKGAEALRDVYPDLEFKVYVDTGPTRDRVWAKYAGLGWFGKNSCLINPKIGSYFFVGEILWNLPLLTDQPVADRCGTCTRCIESCPTQAIVENGVVDSRRCISYLTIELKGSIPEEMREKIGNHIFGCDICQDVCPWNRSAPVSDFSYYQPRPEFFNPDLKDIYRTVRENFSQAFRKSAMKRTKKRGLLRNLAVAMGNSGNISFVSDLEELREWDEPVVQEHAEWALQKLENQIEK
ncbi:MAG: tRNA epoxyqueuosine(34) reductase QueG [Calditrichaeota bacterium]|nr:tRNA epoxyqueuosine(34) reductase QueG [Calditrichota bacterium]